MLEEECNVVFSWANHITFGSSLVQFAITWYITLNTQSGMMLTISIICGFLPTLPLPLLECGLTGITVNADNSIGRSDCPSNFGIGSTVFMAMTSYGFFL